MVCINSTETATATNYVWR